MFKQGFDDDDDDRNGEDGDHVVSLEMNVSHF